MPIPELASQADVFLAKKEDQRLKSLLTKQSPHAIAQIIDLLPHGKRKSFGILPPELQAEVAVELSERSKAMIFPRLSDHTLARFLHFNDEDEAADILHALEEPKRAAVLQYVKGDKRSKIEKLLHFSPESAGGLMDLNFITVEATLPIKEVAERASSHVGTHKEAPLVVVIDDQKRILGFLPYRSLLLAQPQRAVTELVHAMPVVPHTTDQEKVLRIAIRERSEAVAVTDEHHQILGIIHLKDLLKIAQEEATEDVYGFAGVSAEEEMLDTASVAIRHRHRWLIMNLGTAFLASFVVSMFESTIAKTAILAAYMPIVAGMGGNAGTQTLAVVVRGLALDSSAKRFARRIVTK